MWKFSDKALNFLEKLAQGRPSPVYIEFVVEQGGQSTAQLSVQFAQPQKLDSYESMELRETLIALVLKKDAEFLVHMSVDLIENQTSEELEIQAPKLYGEKTQWTLVEKINQFISAEIAPHLRSHNGSAKVLEINAKNQAILEFSGGCQGCSMAQVTLKSGIEKRLIEQFPEITAVVDFTDHQKGENPYYQS